MKENRCQKVSNCGIKPTGFIGDRFFKRILPWPCLPYVSYRVFNCILVHFIPLPVFIFYSFFFFILFYLLFFHVHCTGLFFLFFFFISILFLSTRFPCSLYQRGWDCTGVGGTIPRGQSLCESMSLCRCLVFILCMPVCNYTLRLTLCAVYG